MITSITNKLAEIIKESILLDAKIKTVDQMEERKNQIIKELCKQLGETNTHRLAGIINGTYQMKLTDAMVIYRFFHLRSIEDLVEVKFTEEPKTFQQLQKRKAA